MKTIRCIAILAAVGLTALAGTEAAAQRTTRAVKAAKAAVCAPLRIEGDTLQASAADVALSGYQKPLRARRETMFATNRTDRLVEGLELRIVYLDHLDRQLHSRTLWVDEEIPAGETRRIAIQTWDIDNTFYYAGGDVPRKRATPYTVRIDVLRIVAATE